MSSSPEIKCDFCGYQFKVFSKIERQFVDQYEEDDVTCYYPLPEENAHLVHNYICDKCYNKIGNIVKDKLLKSGKEYTEELSERLEKEYNKYLKKVDELKAENIRIQNCYNILNNIKNIYELDSEIVNEIKNGHYPYSAKGTYYLDRAIDIERKNKLGIKKIREWENDFSIKISQLPQNYHWNDSIEKNTFLDILFDCKIDNMTSRQILELVKNNQ